MKPTTAALIFFFLCTTTIALGQFSFDGELRPRAQVRNGYLRLRNNGDSPAIFVAQRTRLNAAYQKSDLFDVYISVQDVRVWGDQDQLVDEASIGLFQAWGEVKLADKFRLKIGRQELVYDQGYLLATLNWREAGRSHDLALFKYTDSTFTAHLGLAHNQNSASLANSEFTNDYYKNMHFLWLHKKWAKTKASLMVINRGLQRSDNTIQYTQTIGPEIQFSSGLFTIDGAFYYQTGQDTLLRDVSASLMKAEVSYQASTKLTFRAGVVSLSGTDQDAQGNDNHTFDILYGYRHRHYGHMDYFYLGFTPPTGLRNFFAKASLKPTEKLTLNADLHFFSTEAQLAADGPLQAETAYLGTELDLDFKLKLYDEVSLAGGYSHMFATEDMERLRGGDRNLLSNWVWLQINFKPKFF